MAPENSTALTADNSRALAPVLTALTAETCEALTALIFNSLSVAGLSSLPLATHVKQCKHTFNCI